MSMKRSYTDPGKGYRKTKFPENKNWDIEKMERSV